MWFYHTKTKHHMGSTRTRGRGNIRHRLHIIPPVGGPSVRKTQHMGGDRFTPGRVVAVDRWRRGAKVDDGVSGHGHGRVPAHPKRDASLRGYRAFDVVHQLHTLRSRDDVCAVFRGEQICASDQGKRMQCSGMAAVGIHQSMV